ncbi:MAG: heparinase II/III family protein [Eisenbergiella sp.]
MGADSDYLRFHCGCMGSGHGHGDQLHVDYFSHGEDILVDAGRYTYVDNDIRKRLKAPAAHNTVCIDGENFCECVDSWGYSRMTCPGGILFLPGWEWYQALILGIWIKGASRAQGCFAVEGLMLLCDAFYSCGRQGQENPQAGLRPEIWGRRLFTAISPVSILENRGLRRLRTAVSGFIPRGCRQGCCALRGSAV